MSETRLAIAQVRPTSVLNHLLKEQSAERATSGQLASNTSMTGASAAEPATAAKSPPDPFSQRGDLVADENRCGRKGRPGPAPSTSPAPSPTPEAIDGPNGLVDVDWNFVNRIRHTELEALHPYPAKFIADLPRAVIACLPPRPGTLVLDPFCGSGTTLAECQRVGLPSVGIDLNPIACLIARVRTAAAPNGIEDEAAAIASTAVALEIAAPPIPNLDHWFRPEAQRALAALTSLIEEVDEPGLRDVLSLALSSIVVRVSNQDSDTRYAAVAKEVTVKGAVAAFEKAAVRIATALRGRDYELARTVVIEANTLEFDAASLRGRVGLVVTSPPYPNAYEYWLYHKYRMFWLGRNPLAVKAAEIGARAHFFRKNHHTAEDFSRQMGATLDLVDEVLIEGGHACFVVGRSKIHGKSVDNAAIIAAEGERRGYEIVFSTERTIASTRKSFNLSHANIKTETVMVIRRKAV